ncbi:YmL10 [Bulinus truncatus]|nr:YmL10 [Bulinus truncatus]
MESNRAPQCLGLLMRVQRPWKLFNAIDKFIDESIQQKIKIIGLWFLVAFFFFLKLSFIYSNMASNFKGVVRYFSVSSRHLRKPNIQKPHVPWTERRILNAVSTPIFPPDERTLPMKCYDEMKAKEAAKNTELADKYRNFKMKQVSQMLNDNVMVAICHIVPMSSRDAFSVRAKIITAKMKLTFISNKFVKECIQGTKFCNLEPFITSDTVYIVSNENKVAELVSILRKTPELQLLGGLVENNILSREVMLNYAKLPPIDVLRGELLTILTSSVSTTSRLLPLPPQQLSNSLTQLTQQGSSETAAGTATSEQEQS